MGLTDGSGDPPRERCGDERTDGNDEHHCDDRETSRTWNAAPREDQRACGQGERPGDRAGPEQHADNEHGSTRPGEPPVVRPQGTFGREQRRKHKEGRHVAGVTNRSDPTVAAAEVQQREGPRLPLGPQEQEHEACLDEARPDHETDEEPAALLGQLAQRTPAEGRERDRKEVGEGASGLRTEDGAHEPAGHDPAPRGPPPVSPRGTAQVCDGKHRGQHGPCGRGQIAFGTAERVEGGTVEDQRHDEDEHHRSKERERFERANARVCGRGSGACAAHGYSSRRTETMRETPDSSMVTP